MWVEESPSSEGLDLYPATPRPTPPTTPTPSIMKNQFAYVEAAKFAPDCFQRDRSTRWCKVKEEQMRHRFDKVVRDRSRTVTKKSINENNIRDLQQPEYVSILHQVTGHVADDSGKVVSYTIDNGGEIQDSMLEDWALHLRRHYVRDDELKRYCDGEARDVATVLREDYIPDKPTIRSGDFGEILMSDILQFIEGYEVPRYKQVKRANHNMSDPGVDVVAYRISDPIGTNSSDELVTIEVKTRVTPRKNQLSDAILDAEQSAQKDHTRIAMTLRMYKKRSSDVGDEKTKEEMIRFMMKSEKPYKHVLAIAVVIGADDLQAQSEEIEKICESEECDSETRKRLRFETVDKVRIVYRSELMDLIHSIYEGCVL